jgi:hypothetical protein
VITSKGERKMVNEHFIGKTDEEILVVLDGDPVSKAIGYMNVNLPGDGIIDRYQFGLLFSSIDKLKQAATNNVFVWETNDRSLLINGNGQSWLLRINPKYPPYHPVFVQLTAEETELLKEALFKPVEVIISQS